MANPRSCGPAGTPLVDDGVKRSLPGTSLTFTRAEANYFWRPVDWYPGDHPEMARIAAWLTEEEKQQVAEYFSSIPFRSMVRVVESEQAPQVSASLNRLLMAVEGAPWQALGNQIVEVAEDAEETEIMRNPRGTFVAYVPVGSRAKGEQLVTTGGGKTVGRSVCHGAGLQGLGDVPNIAGRTASYTTRQLWDIKQGSRLSPLMASVVANLAADDMMNIAAYVATLPP